MNPKVDFVIDRNGEKRHYQPERIMSCLKRAFQASEIIIKEPDLLALLDKIEASLANTNDSEEHSSVHLEHVQDTIETQLMISGHGKTAKKFIIYRQRKADQRLLQSIDEQEKIHKIYVTKRNGKRVLFKINKIQATLTRVSHSLDTNTAPLDLIITELEKNIFEDISTDVIDKALILSTTPFIEKDPVYNVIAARLLRQKLYKEVTKTSIKNKKQLEKSIKASFVENIEKGVKADLFHEELLKFDLPVLGKALVLGRDEKLNYTGVYTLADRYLIKVDKEIIETIQAFWMRVSMGLAIQEEDRNAKALEFYSIISQLLYVPSTPTLFHSGLKRPQLSSCYITTISDDLQNIFKCIGDNAQMAKWSGGIGNDWTPVRATNARIKSTNVSSQGVIPFLKIANDTTVAINRSGKRRGATCAYLEAWHLDFEDFIDLRKNTGDERRRTHDMNTASWIPDLFMKRVNDKAEWTLFSPDEVPDLHEIYGMAFEKKYLEYESLAKEGKIRNHKTIEAVSLWRKLLRNLYETGHPWITFKDPCNLRSPQDHVGVIHSSNLCTEITLNNSSVETAVCNLGSINLSEHITSKRIDRTLLAKTIKTAIRALDNVIDINFYPTSEGKKSNLQHRPIGLGIMGLQDALFKLKLPFEVDSTLSLMDETMEYISYHAILNSSELAKERGAYPSFKGSKWDRDLLPLDTVDLLEKERGIPIEVNRNSSLDWSPVRNHIKKHGMRNSNTMAIAPTATISNIAGCFPCIEPIYKNIYVKSNMSGQFTILNQYLVQDLKELGLWSHQTLDLIKYYDGDIRNIGIIPQRLRDLYQETFAIDPIALIKLTAVRAKWIDQSQSHNIFLNQVTGSKLHQTYNTAWKMGLKTTYYLRTLGASQTEKSTLSSKEYGFTQTRDYKIAKPTEVNALAKENVASSTTSKLETAK